jgi:hypothetical protein
MQHSSRAHLLIHARKTDHATRIIVEKKVNAFTKILSYSLEISKVFGQLQLFGKTIPQGQLNETLMIME